MNASETPVVDPGLKDDFLDLKWRMAPANLVADGRLPPAQARARYASLRERWARLERRVGRKVEEAEVTAWFLERYELQRA